jgi:hypothetical protein
MLDRHRGTGFVKWRYLHWNERLARISTDHINDVYSGKRKKSLALLSLGICLNTYWRLDIPRGRLSRNFSSLTNLNDETIALLLLID